MTTEEYGKAYQKGFNLTVRFLVSRGLSYDAALDTAQAAWAKGWERREQLRDPNLVLTWTNSIALNIHRTYLRREPQTLTLPELQAPPRMNVAAIDVKRILSDCKPNDRVVLEGHYIEGYKVQEIARQHGWSETAVRIRLVESTSQRGKTPEPSEECPAAQPCGKDAQSPGDCFGYAGRHGSQSRLVVEQVRPDFGETAWSAVI